MSYCVVCVVLYLYGSLPPVVCSVGGLMSYYNTNNTIRHEPSSTTNNCR
jgi:hypothetical protein